MEVFREFLRLKRQELFGWMFEGEKRKVAWIALSIVVIILVCSFGTGELVIFLDNKFYPSEQVKTYPVWETTAIGFYLLVLLIGALLGITLIFLLLVCLVKWLHDNWKQAKYNVEQRKEVNNCF